MTPEELINLHGRGGYWVDDETDEVIRVDTVHVPVIEAFENALDEFGIEDE